ncbi:MAG: class I SAM-dependent methyltransferase [Akkermansiaceae bacterium]|nr:class I SAM-dependent methyltransferase [Verrucomicrobiales bacterium]
MSATYTTKQHWDAYFSEYQPKKVGSVFFAEIFEKYLRPDPSKAVLEVGCAGGEYLCYVHQRFGFQAFGVDYSDEIKKTTELFAYNQVAPPALFHEDFFTWQPGRKFDVVYSIGFIEHFEDPRLLIQRHVDLLETGGKLIITLPHFAHLQYLFHWLIDRENLAKHNTKIMRLGVLRKALRDLPLRIEHLNYYQTFGFWTERKTWNAWQRLINQSIELFGKVAWKILGFRTPNFLFSPHIVLVATKQ